MYRGDFGSGQDSGDDDQPIGISNECKSLIDQIFKFNYSEAPIYGEATETDIEKQDVSYRLLEEENFVLKSQVLSLQESINSKEVEINDLKTSFSKLQCKVDEEESCIEEISLLDVGDVIKRIGNTIEDIVDEKIREPLKSRDSSNLRISESSKEHVIDNITTSSGDISILTAGTTRKDLLTHSDLEKNEYSTFNETRENEILTSRNLKENRLVTLEDSYLAAKSENLVLKDKIKTFTSNVTKLKSTVNSCEQELVEYDKVLSLIKKERYNIISELRQAKQDCNALKISNDYLEGRVFDLENHLQSQEICQRSEDNTQLKLLQCYKNRLYEAFKELTVKEGQIEKLNGSINEFEDKFKVDKSSLETEYFEQLRESEERLKVQHEDEVKLHETIRQQWKLIGHLQALAETKDKKPSSIMNCLKDN